MESRFCLRTRYFSKYAAFWEVGGLYRVMKKGLGTLGAGGGGRVGHVDGHLEISRSLETVWKFAGNLSNGEDQVFLLGS